VLFEGCGWVTDRKFQWKVGCPPTNFGVRTLEFLSYDVVLLRGPTFSRFDTVPACDTRTHRQTDRQAHRHAMMAITCASRVARG